MRRKTQVLLEAYEDVEREFLTTDRKDHLKDRLQALYQPSPGVAGNDRFELDVQFGTGLAGVSIGKTDDALAQDLAGLTELPPGGSTWFCRVLIAKSSDRQPDPYGVLFDLDGRRACAVFTDAFHDTGFDPRDLLVRTVAHELGHVFNLAHEDARGDLHQIFHMTTAFASVNTPNISDACWEHLLRHDTASVQPGSGLAFLSRNCPGHPPPDSDGVLAVAGRPSRRRSSLELRIEPGQVYPGPSEPTFIVGESVHLTVTLTNPSSRGMQIPRWPSSASQELVLYRTDPSGRRTVLSPPLRFCAEPSSHQRLRLEPGATAAFHETVHFRNGALIFPQEGRYRLEAALRVGNRWLASPPVEARVAPPLKTRHEDSSAAAAHPVMGHGVELGGAVPEAARAELARKNPRFPMHTMLRLADGRQAVFAPRKTSARHLAQLALLARQRALPQVVRAEAELLLLLDRSQAGDRQAAAKLRSRLADPFHLPISPYRANQLNRRLADMEPPSTAKEKP